MKYIDRLGREIQEGDVVLWIPYKPGNDGKLYTVTGFRKSMVSIGNEWPRNVNANNLIKLTELCYPHHVDEFIDVDKYMIK